VNRLLGVRNVINLINIKPRVTAFDVRTKIADALRRTATVDAERVSIEVDGSRVILNGKVKSFTEKEDVEDAAWCAPGVSRVESHLEVEPVETFAF
jgi:osmotically-inducible protein OsmY